MAACEIARRPQPAVPTVMVSSGFGKEIMARRMNSVMAQPAHMGCSSRISLKLPICDTVFLRHELFETRREFHIIETHGRPPCPGPPETMIWTAPSGRFKRLILLQI